MKSIKLDHQEEIVHPKIIEVRPKPKIYYSAIELLDLEIKEVPKLWDPFLPARGVAGLTGTSDCGKSMFLRQLAMAISLRKTEFLGYPLNTRYGRALYVCTEDDHEGTAAILTKQVGNAERKRFSNLHFVFDCTDLLKEVEKFLQIKRCDLVVLDVWSDTFTGNPNNWVDVRQNLKVLKSLADKNECLIVVIHHTVKNSEKNSPDKNKLNGSQAIEAKLRALLELRTGALSNERIIYVLKHNYMSRDQKAEGLQLVINPETLLFENTGKKIPLSGTVNDSTNKSYDANKWIPLMLKLKEQQTGLSFENARKQLAEEFGEDEVPGITWFKNHSKTFISQSDENL